jgi:type I restriction enzyme R subunit
LRERLVDQLLAKLRAKERRMSDEARGCFQELTGLDPRAFADQLRREGAGAAAETLASLPQLPNLLDHKYSQNNPWILSLHDDQLRREAWGYGSSQKPEDYLDAFASYLRQNMNQIPALLAVTQRPRELTRAQLKELRLLLDAQGFRESYLQTAWREKSNADIAASIIGFIRQAALGDALVPYPERVDRALRTLLASRPWTPGQRKWLQRIGAQMKVEVIVDRTNLDEGEFKAQAGGFDRLNKQFKGELEGILGDLRELAWAGAQQA